MNTIVAISGNIGAGKTSLIRNIAAISSCMVLHEPVENNPYLQDFYSDMESWAAQVQYYFLGQRALQHRLASACELTAILDRTIYEDAQVFAPMLAQAGLLSRRDFATYQTLYEAVSANVRAPDLFVYLHASVDTLSASGEDRGGVTHVAYSAGADRGRRFRF